MPSLLYSARIDSNTASVNMRCSFSFAKLMHNWAEVDARAVCACVCMCVHVCMRVCSVHAHAHHNTWSSSPPEEFLQRVGLSLVYALSGLLVSLSSGKQS